MRELNTWCNNWVAGGLSCFLLEPLSNAMKSRASLRLFAEVLVEDGDEGPASTIASCKVEALFADSVVDGAWPDAF